MEFQFPRKRAIDRTFAPPQITTLVQALPQAFIEANPRRVQQWLNRYHTVLPQFELVVFSALLCGCYFRYERPDLSSELGKVWTSLTQHPINMDDQTASYVVCSIAPCVKRLIAKRGYCRGLARGSMVTTTRQTTEKHRYMGRFSNCRKPSCEEWC
jgi:hypothetical protein